ncbi:MAG: DedA family protein [Vicinamibacterales bacterium]
MRVIDFILHFDKHLLEFVSTYGTWVYGILFAIVFAETGLVIMPFLPGDSLLFATGALAARGVLNPWLAGGLLLAASILGDGVNYAVGKYIGPKAFVATDSSTLVSRLMNRDHLQRAHDFFERYGGKAVVLGRFVPIVRTFVPFVAGAGSMNYGTFVFYNVTGGILWVGLCMGAGLLFGNIPVVRENFSLITLGIVAVSVLPVVVEFIRQRRLGR